MPTGYAPPSEGGGLLGTWKNIAGTDTGTPPEVRGPRGGFFSNIVGQDKHAPPPEGGGIKGGFFSNVVGQDKHTPPPEGRGIKGSFYDLMGKD